MTNRGWIVPGLLVLLGSAFAVPASGSDVPIDWETIAPMSLPRHSGASAVVDGLIYAIGGADETGAVADTVFIGEIVNVDASE